MDHFLNNVQAQPFWVQFLMVVLALLLIGSFFYVVGTLIFGIYRAFRPKQETPESTTLPGSGVMVGIFYLGRKLVGAFLIGLGSLLLWEMATMLSAKDMTYKVVFGMGGCAVVMIIGGVLCLITKKGEKALKE